ncbi:MAG: hypothetical protein JWN45_29 [Acidobacteriaceae bacterium]|nr:hypothetical protein [Acidobacteriaceae bacterium]
MSRYLGIVLSIMLGLVFCVFTAYAAEDVSGAVEGTVKKTDAAAKTVVVKAAVVENKSRDHVRTVSDRSIGKTSRSDLKAGDDAAGASADVVANDEPDAIIAVRGPLKTCQRRRENLNECAAWFPLAISVLAKSLPPRLRSTKAANVGE